VLPQAAEAAHLALEVAARLAEALEARLPVDGVDLGERVDELFADVPALGRRVERRGHAGRDDVAVHALHHVERCADDGLVVADREHFGYARGRAADRVQEPRLAQDVVGARRQGRPGRTADDEVAVAAAHEVRDVRVPLAERLDLEVARAEPVLVEERLQRLDDEQRRALVGGGLGVASDNVVRGGCDGHLALENLVASVIRRGAPCLARHRNLRRAGSVLAAMPSALRP
jgi:hypothetical protein